MIVLGIDPGLANVGWGVVKKSNNKILYLDSGCIHTFPVDTIEKRMSLIYDNIEDILKEYNPAYMSVEDLFFGKNSKSAISVAMTKGVLALCAFKNNLKYKEFSPLQVKRAVVGESGRIQKEQLQFMIKFLLGITKDFKTDHESDAIALAISYINYN